MLTSESKRPTLNTNVTFIMLTLASIVLTLSDYVDFFDLEFLSLAESRLEIKLGLADSPLPSDARRPTLHVSFNFLALP